MSLGYLGEEFDVEALCKWTKENNLDYIDWFGTYGRDPKDFRQMMDDYGLKTSCYTFFADFIFPDISLASEEIDNFKKNIDIACILGTDTVMLPVPSKENIDGQTARKYYCSILNQVISYAKDRNITVTCENFSHLNSPFVTSKDMLEANGLCPDLYVCFDSGNILTKWEDPCKSFINTKDIIKFVHLKDFVKTDGKNENILNIPCNDGTFITPALIGEGLIDYKSLVPLVNKYYDGYVNIEYEAKDLTPETSVLKAIDYLKSLE